jgi:predicted nucleotidyltransferase
MKIKILQRNKEAHLHDDLEPNIWGDGKLKPEIREALMDIAQEFYNTLEVDAPLEDVRFTGSLANFNYTPKSDIDLHLVIDFSKVDENEKLVKNYFDAKRILWNNKHIIIVKGYEVEVYVENIEEQHHSTGIYSIKGDEWILEPQPVEEPVDLTIGDKKAAMIATEVEAAMKKGNLSNMRRLKEKIKKMRGCGLETKGIFSPENLAFKKLRNDLVIDRLSRAITKEYDRQFSLPEERART